MEKEYIFLTIEQARRAITIDFRQYDPQILLFCSIIGLISDHAIRFKREPDKGGLWVNQTGSPNMRWLEGDRLVEFMCSAVNNAKWTPELLATVSSRVFHSRVQTATDPETGRMGVRIETQMASFACRQCGRCCSALDYRYEVNEEDVLRWKALDRRDILQWVERVDCHKGRTGYRVWVVPGTHKRSESCPFLKKNPANNLWVCQIHTVKPQICRNYPVSRKHALMTGCRGFDQPAMGQKQ